LNLNLIMREENVITLIDWALIIIIFIIWRILSW
jgi:hypothetical protein